jgi:hypothetical protein
MQTGRVAGSFVGCRRNHSNREMNARSYTATSPSRMNALGLSPLTALTSSGNRGVRSRPFRLTRRTAPAVLSATIRQPSTFSS